MDFLKRWDKDNIVRVLAYRAGISKMSSKLFGLIKYELLYRFYKIVYQAFQVAVCEGNPADIDSEDNMPSNDNEEMNQDSTLPQMYFSKHAPPACHENSLV